jgi:hypothetical protein
MNARLIEEVLIRGVDDWVYLAAVGSWSRSLGGATTVEETRAMTLSVIRTLLDEGLCEVGDVREGGFLEWEVSSEAALERIRTEWERLGPELEPGDICWLANTAKGDERGEELLQERQGSRSEYRSESDDQPSSSHPTQ